MIDRAEPKITYSTLIPDHPGFDEMCGRVADLHAAREREFNFNSHIAHPRADAAAFRADPQAVVSALSANAAPIIILTTWAGEVRDALCAAGFFRDPVDWPAGPANTAIFSRPGQGAPCYLEIVDEEDPAIAPNLVVSASDGHGLVGGAISVLRGGAAWLAVMAVRAGSPPGSGTRLWNALLAAYRCNGVRRLDLGTQTAGPFYSRCGMGITHLAIRDLRWRSGENGPVWTDLQMMTLAIDP